MKQRWFWVIGVVSVIVVLIAVGGGVVIWGMSGSKVTGSVVDARDGKALATATVKVDGQPVALSRGGLDAKLALGKRQVTITAPGYETVTRSLDVRFFKTAALGTVSLRNADLKLKVVENYPGARPIKGAQVKLGAAAGKTDKKGVVTLTAVPVGSATATATSPTYEKGKSTLVLRPGTNAATLTLAPGVAVVAKRSIDALLANDDETLWKLTHPDRKGSKAAFLAKQKKAWAKFKSYGVVFTSSKIAAPVHVASRHVKELHRTYKNVWRTKVTLWASSSAMRSYGMAPISMTGSYYWVKSANGQWLAVDADGFGVN